MLSKLRIQFIVLNLVLACLVLVAAFSTVCYLDYQQRLREVYNALSTTLYEAQSPNISQIETTIQLQKGPSATSTVIGGDASHTEDKGESEDDQRSTAATPTPVASVPGTQTNQTTQIAGGPEIGGSNSGESVIPVAVYLAKPDGTYTALGDYASASIQHVVLITANAEVLEARSNSGGLPDVGLYYERRQTSNGTLIAYADASNVDAWQQLAITLSLVGLVILIAFLLINIFFSWWAFKPVERAWQQQTQFVADASHELKTPLTVILANMAILRGEPDATVNEQSQWVESTQTEAERMQALVNDMLEMARPENAAAAATGGSFEPLDLTDIAEAEVLQFESVAFDKGVTIESDLQPDIYVEGNPARLQRLVGTLIDNACKYADADGQVDVELEAVDKYEAELRVHNTGPAIAEEDLPHVFDRFYRADKARTSGKGGFGLGLAIARGIAQEHAGDITVASAEGEGTTFTVTLPICDPPADIDDVDDADDAEAAEGPAPAGAEDAEAAEDSMEVEDPDES